MCLRQWRWGTDMLDGRLRPSLVLGLLLVAICAGVQPTSAQDRLKIEIVPKIAHTGWVESVAFSPDGTRVLSGSWDNTLKLWDVATGRLLRTFSGHSKEVKSVAFSPAGTRALSGSWDRTLKLWDASTGQPYFLGSQGLRDRTRRHLPSAPCSTSRTFSMGSVHAG